MTIEKKREYALMAWRLRGVFKYRQKRLPRAMRRVFRRSQKQLEQAFRRAVKPKIRFRDEAEKKIAKALRRRLGKIIKGYRRKTEDLIGCPVPQLRAHLESQFQPGMSWDNYGLWHIDHICPCVRFDLRIPEQQRECFHFTNLQPLWAGDNREKGIR